MVSQLMIGVIIGFLTSPLIYVGMSALYSTAEAVNQDVESNE